MKFHNILVAAAATLMLGGLAACESDTKPITAAELAGASQTDSLMYWLGQVNAIEYLNQAERDTTLKTFEARKEFLRGLRVGLDAIKEMEPYNTGVWQGVQMAINLHELAKEYPDLKFNDAIMTRSMAEALVADSTPDAAKAQANFERIFSAMEAEKAERELAASIKDLPAVAKKLGMTEVAPHLFSKTITPGNGAPLQRGEKVATQITVTRTDGTPVRLPLPKEVQIGARYVSRVLTEALTTMNMNGVSTFATSAYALFGKRCESLNLQPSEVLTVEIKTGDGQVYASES
ncbi:MAG: hypothetical protein K2O24_02850 [Muribaculaceae bacterium]|nr:hypothetical protein [Muribaculaceae bacterium]